MPQVGADYPGVYGDFFAWFGDDEDCLNWLWCPDEDFALPVLPWSQAVGGSGRWRCARCRKWVPATSGTLFAKTRTPLAVCVGEAW